MTVNERLVSYLSNRRVISCDPRWEDLLNDVRSGYVRLDRDPDVVETGRMNDHWWEVDPRSGRDGAWIVVHGEGRPHG
jgi:hypothetical protein